MEAEIAKNIIEILNGLWNPVKVVGIFIGYIMIGTGLITWAVGSDASRGSGFYSSLLMLIAGFFLVSLDAFLQTASYSLLEEHSKLDTLGYSASGGGDVTATYIQLAFAIVKFLGLICGIKAGYTLWSHSQDKDSSIFTVVFYIFLAVIGLNCESFLEITGVSLGGVVETSISKILEAT